MELLFIVLGGIIAGTIARYIFPHRDGYGVLVLPALGGSVAAVLWVALTWAGMQWNSGWIWVITFGVTVLVVGITAPALGVLRKRHDEARLVALRHA